MNYFIQIIRTIQDILSFATLHLCDPETILLTGAFRNGEHPHPPTGHLLYLTEWQERGSRSAHPGDFLFRFSDVETNLDRILGKWFEIADRMRPVRDLYFKATYAPRSYVESDFIAVVQAIEVFHRCLRGGTYVLRDEFEENVRKTLAAAVPPDISSEFRQSLLQRIRFANEFSLRKRLKELYKENRTVIDKLVHDTKSYLADAVKYRNYLTHYTGDFATVRIDLERMAMCTELIRLLLELSLLRELGFSNDKIMERASACHSYQFRYSRWPRPFA